MPSMLGFCSKEKVSKSPVHQSANGSLRMKEEQYLEARGEITQNLNGYWYVVKLITGHEIKCVTAGRMVRNKIRIQPGDPVMVEVSIYDPARGRIFFR